MKILLIVILAILAIFVLLFIAGILSNVIKNSKKRRLVYALYNLAQLPMETIMEVSRIFVAYKQGDVNEVNTIVQQMGQEGRESLIKAMAPENRLARFSAGKFGDQGSWTAWNKSLLEGSYSPNASKIIPGIFLNHYDEVLATTKPEQVKNDSTKSQ